MQTKGIWPITSTYFIYLFYTECNDKCATESK